MITVQSTPPVVSLIGNPMRFRLSSDNHLETAGTLARFYIYFTSKGQPNDTITLLYGDVRITFTVKASPDPLANEISDGSADASLDDWIIRIAPEIASNYFISRDWQVTTNAAQLHLTARVAGPAFNMSWIRNWTDTLPQAISHDGVDAVYRTFYKLGCQLLIKTGFAFTQIAEDILPLDASGEAIFDLHELFADRIDPEFSWPESAANPFILRAGSVLEYRIRYFEQYGNPVTVQRFVESESFFAMYGAVSTLQLAKFNRGNATFLSDYQLSKRFLTWQPRTKTTDPGQPEKLFFLVTGTYASIKLKMEVRYNNGSPAQTVTMATVLNPALYSIYEILCGLKVLKPTGYNSGIIDQYKIWLENSDSQKITEVRTYTVDNAWHENTRRFLFRNSLGGWDSLRLTGDQQLSNEYTRETVRKTRAQSFTELEFEDAINAVEESRPAKVNTGWISKAEAGWLRDLFLSDKVYILDKTRVIPILITSTSFTESVDRDDLQSIEFEYRRSYPETAYTPEMVPASFSSDFSSDFEM